MSTLVIPRLLLPFPLSQHASAPCCFRTHSTDSPTQPASSPRLLFSLTQLEDQVKAAYKLVTEGKFTEALKASRGGVYQAAGDQLGLLYASW